MKTLYVSPAGGTGLRIMNIFECEMKTKYYADGWRMKKTPIFLPYGSLVHHHAARPYVRFDRFDNQLPKSDVNPQEAAETMTRIVDTGQNVDPDTGEAEEVDVSAKAKADYPTMIHSQLTVWDQRRYPEELVDKCEFRMKTIPVDPSSEKSEVSPQEIADLDFNVVGKLDYMIKSIEDGHLCIRDLKTSSSSMKGDWSEFDYAFQLSSYRYMWAALGNQEINDLAAFQLVKNKTIAGVDKHAREISFQPIRYDRVFMIIVDAVKKYRACEASGVWGRNPSSCKGLYSPCPFLALCWPEAFPDPQAAVKETLIKKEAHA